VSEEDVSGPLKLLSLAFGLSPRQQGLILRILWVTIVSTHILWACGLLAFMGLNSPWAKAEDVSQLIHNVALATKLTLSQELRDQYAIVCHTQDVAARAALLRYIESLQVEYQNLTGQRYPEPACR
jgi:hypothetical protein